ncbi:hypothetical protein L1N85_07800 [Paenibacillus alkaliterrae]|uniref:hypothetical protein n=1 Tax=Paenibacillus alkaliterrae TaxID=320909 RepID=UPI001F454E5A|nr:hypothetical protein [Paenibacillus alkaliterrae]MCF2938336.1 hypothetical protein [Paenibacillus alkaliterrae]
MSGSAGISGSYLGFANMPEPFPEMGDLPCNLQSQKMKSVKNDPVAESLPDRFFLPQSKVHKKLP